ncbi:MAG: DNA polymerase III subunit beta [Acidobacteriota bacterium]
MEFAINQNILKEELSFVQGIVERKATIPVLSNILIESVGEGTIRMTGTDLDVTIRCEAEADIRKSGAICVSARKLFDIVRLLDGGSIHFVKEENEWVRLSCGKSKFRLAGVNKEQYPEVPSFKSAPLKMSAVTFNKFIQNTAFAITNEQSRFTLSGAKFVMKEGVAKMVTTDGHRLAYIEQKISGKPEEIDCLIPKKALTELTKISKNSEEDISFGEDQNHIYFEVEGRLLITRKLAGTFPNYEMVIPRDNDKKAIFDVDEMRAAVRRVSLMADERARSIKFIVKEGEVEIVAQNSDDGEGQERVAADYSGPEVTIGFNSQYLQDFLSVAAGAFEESSNEDGEGKKTISKARVSFEFKDGNSQTQMSVSGSNEYDYKYIVMPLRI